MIDFSSKLMTVKPSATLSITSKAKAMVKAGEDVIILAAGEPDFGTPQIIKDAAIKAINDGFTRYTPVSGILSLKEAVCSKLKKDNGLTYSTDEIVVSCGAKHSLYNVLQAICNPKDEVLIIPPYWLSYEEMVRLAGGVPKVLTVEEKNNFKINADQIKAAITDKTKALIINSPSNPAGIIYDEKELTEIGKICTENNILIISDEIYEKIIYDGKKHFSIAAVSDEVKASTIVVNGVSKSYAMTGWRIGYIAGNKKIASMVSTLQSHSTSNPCSISQVAAECALRTDLEGEMKKNCDTFQKRRDILLEKLAPVEKITPLKPEGAFYMFCDISKTGMDSLTFSQKLLEEKKVAVIPGGPFGDDRFIRVSFATSMENIEKGTDRIIEWIG